MGRDGAVQFDCRRQQQLAPFQINIAQLEHALGETCRRSKSNQITRIVARLAQQCTVSCHYYLTLIATATSRLAPERIVAALITCTLWQLTIHLYTSHKVNSPSPVSAHRESAHVDPGHLWPSGRHQARESHEVALLCRRDILPADRKVPRRATSGTFAFY